MRETAALYLDLMKKILINTIYEDPNGGPWQPPAYARTLRENGQDWPVAAHTMIGLKRLDARPIATLSLEAQERHERRERVYREE